MFTPARSDAVYCSLKCQRAAYRTKHRKRLCRQERESWGRFYAKHGKRLNKEKREKRAAARRAKKATKD